MPSVLVPPSTSQEFLARERILLAELSAVRSQVDKLLDQQKVLISMLAASGNSSRDVGVDVASHAPHSSGSSSGADAGPLGKRNIESSGAGLTLTLFGLDI